MFSERLLSTLAIILVAALLLLVAIAVLNRLGGLGALLPC